MKESLLMERTDTNSAESKGLDELKASPSRDRLRNGVFNKFNARNGDHLSVRRSLCPPWLLHREFGRFAAGQSLW